MKMSLENKIEVLTDAVNLLTAALLEQKAKVKATEKVESIETPKAEKPKKTEKTKTSKTSKTEKPEKVESDDDPISHDDIKMFCLELSRAKENGRDIAKNILKEFGAIKAADVKEEDLNDVAVKLNGELNA